MNKKIIGFLICMFLIATSLPQLSIAKSNITTNFNKKVYFNPYYETTETRCDISEIFKRFEKNEAESNLYEKDIEMIMGTVLLPEDGRKYEVPSWVRRGDILFMDCRNQDAKNEWARPGKSNDHITIYLGRGYVDKEKWPWEFTLDSNGGDWFIESLGCHNRTTNTNINMN